jgi:hypothetical protein
MSFLHEKAALRRLIDFGGDENRLTLRRNKRLRLVTGKPVAPRSPL